MDRLIKTEIIPLLAQSKQEPLTKDGIPKQLKLPFFAGFSLFIASFAGLKMVLPDNNLAEVLSIVAFPLLFLASIFITGYLFRARLADIFVKGKHNFLLRTQVMHSLSKALGLEFIAVPGGPASSLKKITTWSKCPQTLKDVCAVMEDHSGLGEASEIIKASGLAVPNTVFIGSDETKERYFKQTLNEQQFEDGFKGVRGNISFAAVEWNENHDGRIHHLLIALTLPTKLTGRVEFKNKAGIWPMTPPHRKHNKVKLLSRQFAKAYKVRADDQMEARLIFDPAVIERLTAYAAQGPVRGVAFENHLVVDLIGDNRFDIIDIMTGAWSNESIKKTLSDFDDMLRFLDAISTAFSVKGQRRLSA